MKSWQIFVSGRCSGISSSLQLSGRGGGSAQLVSMARQEAASFHWPGCILGTASCKNPAGGSAESPPPPPMPPTRAVSSGARRFVTLLLAWLQIFWQMALKSASRSRGCDVEDVALGRATAAASAAICADSRGVMVMSHHAAADAV